MKVYAREDDLVNREVFTLDAMRQEYKEMLNDEDSFSEEEFQDFLDEECYQFDVQEYYNTPSIVRVGASKDYDCLCRKKAVLENELDKLQSKLMYCTDEEWDSVEQDVNAVINELECVECELSEGN